MSQKFKSELELQALNNATTDTDKFLVSDGGIVKYRTGTEVLSDLGVTLNTASKLQHQVKAEVAINKGQAVYVTSADGTNMIVGLASNASEATSSKTMGLLDATVAINDFANVVTEGLLAGLNTSTANAGDPVWLGTNGNLIYGLANKPYAPAHLVFLGIVTRVNANNGEIFVNVQNGFELNEIHDIDLKTTTPINGHILGFDGTLWVNKTIAGWLGYTPANASGTTNYLSKFTGSTTLGNSLLFDNGTNVGIGTTVPQSKLEVRSSGAGNNGAVITLNRIGAWASAYSGLKLNTNDDGTDWWNVGMLATGNNTFNIGQNGSAMMSILVNGNVGIGTTSPSQKLSVNGNISVVNNSSLLLNDTAGNPGFQIRNTSSNVALIHQANNGILRYRAGFSSNSANAHIFAVGADTEIVRFTNGGNVGIGTASPGKKLDVVGAVRASDQLESIKVLNSATISNIATDASLLLYAPTTTGNYGGIIGWAEGNVAASISAYDAGSGGALGLSLATGNNTSISEKMRITDTGNVGIGTTSPLNSLQVSRDQTSDTAIIVSNAGTAGATTTMSFILQEVGTPQGWFRRYRDGSGLNEIGFSTDLAFSGNVTSTKAERMRITSAGNLGIGTTSPFSRLTTSGSLSTTSSQISIVNTEGGHIILRAGIASISNAGFSLISANVDGTNQNTRLVIGSSGNVGIGTINPQSTLDVITPTNGYASFARTMGVGQYSGIHFGYREENTSYRKSAIVFERTDLTEPNAQGKVHILNGPQSGGGSATLSDAKLTIAENGNIGIGTVSPQVDLEVASKDSTTTVARIRLTNKDISVIDEQDLSEIQFYNSDADGAHVSAYIKNIAAELYGRKGQLSFGVSTTNSTNAVEAFRIDENANIGIGTTSPTDKLTVNGTFRSTALWTTSGGITQWGNGTTSYGTLTWDAGYARIHAASGNRLDLGASAGLHMSIATSGNVGIGTTSPNEKLHVYGTSVGINIDGTTAARTYYNRNGSYIWSTGLRSGDTKFYIYDERSASRFVIDDSGNVGIGNTSPTQKLDVSGSIKASGSVQVGDDSTVASATNVGATRYRSDANNSYMDMVMQTGASTYAWVNVVQNTW